MLNIGGVANITYHRRPTILIACDTGPGNALIDDFMLARTGAAVRPRRRAGGRGHGRRGLAIARCWRIRSSRSRRRNRSTATTFALSLDRLREHDRRRRRRDPDGVHRGADRRASCALLPKPPRSWIVAGGGARNPTLMRMLRERLAPATVETADARRLVGRRARGAGLRFLAVRALKGLPLTLPATTGVPTPMTGGVLARP